MKKLSLVMYDMYIVIGIFKCVNYDLEKINILIYNGERKKLGFFYSLGRSYENSHIPWLSLQGIAKTRSKGQGSSEQDKSVEPQWRPYPKATLEWQIKSPKTLINKKKSFLRHKKCTTKIYHSYIVIDKEKPKK